MITACIIDEWSVFNAVNGKTADTIDMKLHFTNNT